MKMKLRRGAAAATRGRGGGWLIAGVVVCALVTCQVVAYLYLFHASPSPAAPAPPEAQSLPPHSSSSGSATSVDEPDRPGLDVGDERYVTPFSPIERLQPKRINECRKVAMSLLFMHYPHCCG
jgi:hypothetical protein